MSYYWLQVIPDSGESGTRSVLIPEAEDYIRTLGLENFINRTLANPDVDLILFSRIQNNYDSSAAYCLRCCVSHHIKRCCEALTLRYGRGNFEARDVYPLALEDCINIGEEIPHQILVIRILSSWNPTQGQLSTWTNRVVCKYRLIVNFLEGYGVSKFSDWGLINGVKLGRLERILKSINLDEVRIQQYKNLLIVFKNIYTKERLDSTQGRGQKCQPPTPDQLQRIEEKYRQYNSFSNGSILSKLEEIIVHLRQYEINIRDNFIPQERLQIESDNRVLRDFQTNNNNEDRELLQGSIFIMTAIIIDKRYEKRQRRANGNSEMYLQALNLYFCRNMTQENIAIETDCGEQSTITRLLDLKTLYLDISISVLNELNDQGLIPANDSGSSINQLDETQKNIAKYLNEEVILNDVVRTVLSHAVCQYFQLRETL